MKSIKKYMVIALCAVIVACSAFSPMQVNASGVNPSRIVDVALTKTGIVANQSILKAVEDKLVNIVRETLTLYDEWLKDNPSKEVSTETFNEFVDNGGLSTFKYKAIEPYINRKFITTLMREYQDSLSEAPIDINEVITGEKTLLGVIISLPSELVNFIRSLFDEEAEEMKIMYVDTLGSDDINPLWFQDYREYTWFKQIITDMENVMFVHAYSTYTDHYISLDNNNQMQISRYGMSYFPSEFGLVYNQPSDELTYHYKVYGKDWGALVTKFIYLERANYQNYDLASFESGDDLELQNVVSRIGKHCSKNWDAQLGLFSNDGRPFRVFNTLDEYKLYSVGQQEVYVDKNALDYEKNDNSVNVSGDYITGSNYQYSHDVVQNQIDNSQNVDNSVVNNIVNNNISTIINNYASSVIPDSGNGGNDSGSGGGLGSILDGLGSVISAVADIVGFLLGVIGDVIGLIGQLFTVVFNGLKAIGALVGDFPKLLGDLFVFIPQELINFLVLAIEASVGIAIWRKFSKK